MTTQQGLRGFMVTRYSELVTEECCACGVLFAIPASLQRQLREERDDRTNRGRSFYCPNGHGQSYSGKTEAQREREWREKLERELASREDDLRVERAGHATTRRNLKRIQRRVEAGICPECKRTFQDLARHMHSKHGAEAGAYAVVAGQDSK